jgi:hypothetical protein
MTKNYSRTISDRTDMKGRKHVRMDNMRNNRTSVPIAKRLDKDIKNRYFIFELLDANSISEPCVTKLNYTSVFEALGVLMDYCVDTPLFAKLDEMLEYVAVSPHSLLFDEPNDIADFYYSIEEYVESLCRGFFNSEEDMLNIDIDSKRLSDRKSMVKKYAGIVHVLMQLLFIFGKAYQNRGNILVYADYMTNENMFGI